MFLFVIHCSESVVSFTCVRLNPQAATQPAAGRGSLQNISRQDDVPG